MLTYLCSLFTHSNLCLAKRDKVVNRYAVQVNQHQKDCDQTNTSIDYHDDHDQNSSYKYFLNMFSGKENSESRKRLLDNSNHSDQSTTLGSIMETNDSNNKTKEIPIYAFELTTNEEKWWLNSKLTKPKDDDTKTVTLLILDPQNDFHKGSILLFKFLPIFSSYS